MSHPVSISVVIITYNEQNNIRRCLESVKDIADEIIVVDSFSTDDTRKICLEYGVRFYEHRFEGYAQQKNWGNALAAYSYILSIDADEELSTELRESIRAVKNDCTADGYSFNRMNNYCGRWIRHSGWYPDKKIRLWNKYKGEWKGAGPHERLVMDPEATVIHLKGDLLHYTATSVHDHFSTLNRYAWMQANNDYMNGVRSDIFKRHLYPFLKFFHLYLLRQGFLDGFYGYVIAKTSAIATRLRYLYLHDLHKRKV